VLSCGFRRVLARHRGLRRRRDAVSQSPPEKVCALIELDTEAQIAKRQKLRPSPILFLRIRLLRLQY